MLKKILKIILVIGICILAVLIAPQIAGKNERTATVVNDGRPVRTFTPPEAQAATEGRTKRKAWVTMYSPEDSCHFPAPFHRGCLTASGSIATAGRTIACPERYKFGTKVEIEGHVYTCEDRTASWVQDRNGPTIDVFTESHKEAIRWGRRKQIIYILAN